MAPVMAVASILVLLLTGLFFVLSDLNGLFAAILVANLTIGAAALWKGRSSFAAGKCSVESPPKGVVWC